MIRKRYRDKDRESLRPIEGCWSQSQLVKRDVFQLVVGSELKGAEIRSRTVTAPLPAEKMRIAILDESEEEAVESRMGSSITLLLAVELSDFTNQTLRSH
jgi:hypothetical protein